MTIQALEQNVEIAKSAYELELLFAGHNEDAPEVIDAATALRDAQTKLTRAKAAAKAERDHAETCRIAAAMAEAQTDAEALEILRKANEWEQDQKADAAHHRAAATDIDTAPEDDNSAGLPNEDGINEDGQNVFHPGALLMNAVKPTFRDCRRCGGRGHEPNDQFRTCGSCSGAGCHLVEPWPAGKGVFYWPADKQPK